MNRINVKRTMIAVAVCISLGLAVTVGARLFSAARDSHGTTVLPSGSPGQPQTTNQSQTSPTTEITKPPETSDPPDTSRPVETTHPSGTAQTPAIGPTRSIEIRPILENDRPNAKILGIRVSKVVDGQIEWAYDDHAWTERSYAVQAIETRSGIYVFGSDRRTEWNVQGQGANLYQGRVVFLNHDGKRLWQMDQDSGKNYLSFDKAVAEAQDDSLVIFGSTAATDGSLSDRRFVTAWKFSAAGKLVWRQDNPVDRYREVRLAVPFAGQYLVLLQTPGDDSELVTLSTAGALLGRHELTFDGRRYFVEDILAIGGRAYLSCMTRNDTRTAFERRIVGQLDQINHSAYDDGFPQQDHAIPEPYQSTLLDCFRQEYDAALLSMDPNGTVTVVRVEEHARAGKLAFAGGVLSQQLFRINSVRRAPLLVSSHRIILLGQESAVRLATDGRIIEMKDVGPYRSWW